MKRTSRIFIALCLSLVFCSPVMAQHTGPYVGALLGGNLLLPAKNTDNLGEFSLKFDPALLGSAVVGWDLAPGNPQGEGRVELEYTHRNNPLNQVKFVEGSFTGGGAVIADSLLINFFGVFHDASRWAPYAGLGIGAARMETADLTVTGQPMSNDSAVVFAYQLGAGIDFALTDYLNLDLGYRFFGSSQPGFIESNGRTFKMDYFSHNVIFGLRVGF
jgi:opacity protein-like surface antigen